MNALGESSAGQWQNNQEVPDRFKAVAAGQADAGPHSVTEEHDRARARRQALLAEGNSKTATQKETVMQQFGEVNSQGQSVEGSEESFPGELPTKEDVLEAMRDVIDPELGINIVDLGLVYGVEISPKGLVALEMTLTSAACPLTDMLEQQTYQVLSAMASEVQINWVWMPPWGPERITEDGREQLRALGFNV